VPVTGETGPRANFKLGSNRVRGATTTVGCTHATTRLRSGLSFGVDACRFRLRERLETRVLGVELGLCFNSQPGKLGLFGPALLFHCGEGSRNGGADARGCVLFHCCALLAAGDQVEADTLREAVHLGCVLRSMDRAA